MHEDLENGMVLDGLSLDAQDATSGEGGVPEFANSGSAIVVDVGEVALGSGTYDEDANGQGRGASGLRPLAHS